MEKAREFQKNIYFCFTTLGFPWGSAGKESACNVGDLGSVPGLGRSPGEGKGYPLRYSGLENSLDCIVHGVAKSQAWLRDFHFTTSLTVLKPETVWITTNCGKFLKRYQTTFPVSWETCMLVRKQQLELDMEQWTIFQNWERSTTRLYMVTLFI